MNKLDIRAAGIDDRDVLAGLNMEVQRLHFANRPDVFKPACLDGIAGWLAQLLMNPAASLWMAEDDGVAVGYAVVMVRNTPENPFCVARTWWELDQIGVSAGHRRVGVCRALVRKVLSEARKQKVGEVELNSWAFNQDALEAFRRLGFVAKTTRYELRVDPGGASA